MTLAGCRTLVLFKGAVFDFAFFRSGCPTLVVRGWVLGYALRGRKFRLFDFTESPDLVV